MNSLQLTSLGPQILQQDSDSLIHSSNRANQCYRGHRRWSWIFFPFNLSMNINRALSMCKSCSCSRVVYVLEEERDD